jgi:ABC-2 type transport system permease protein
LVVVLPFLTVIYGIFIGTKLLVIKNIIEFIINILLFVIVSILAGFINNAVSYFVGLMVFHTDHLFGLNMARNAIQGFLGGQMLPLAYMGTLGVVFSFTPFAFMNSVPVLVIMGKMSIMQSLLYILMALLWILAIELANHFIFKSALKKLAVQGG